MDLCRRYHLDARHNRNGHHLVMNPTYHIGRARDLLDEFKSSRERSLAATKLDEFEMWLARCEPTQEALERDQEA